MKVAAEPRSVVPSCHNRPDHAASWSPQRCRTWDGVGIGQPTPEFPSGTPYPMAHGFDCRGCRHLPPEFEALA